MPNTNHHILSIIIPCYNEEKTLQRCVETVQTIADESLALDIIIVDDASTDNSGSVARQLIEKYQNITVLSQEQNSGKGAAIRRGIKQAQGDFLAIQDADLEYDPQDLRWLIRPLISGEADVVIGSRFLAYGPHRVLYFWHSLGNKFLTFLSNMFTDLNLTDMETCYKVFRREIIKDIDIQEDRFGFEPEIIAKVAQKRVRIYEMGISYHGRTYDEGKKIGVKDGFRALYCIFKYNAHKAPLPIQFFIYLFIGGVSAVINLALFTVFLIEGLRIVPSTLGAYSLAAFVNYFFCIKLLFRHRARWSTSGEFLVFLLVVTGIGLVDLTVTKNLYFFGFSLLKAKLTATAVGVFLNFAARKYLVFPEPASGPWKASKN